MELTAEGLVIQAAPASPTESASFVELPAFSSSFRHTQVGNMGRNQNSARARRRQATDLYQADDADPIEERESGRRYDVSFTQAQMYSEACLHIAKATVLSVPFAKMDFQLLGASFCYQTQQSESRAVRQQLKV